MESSCSERLSRTSRPQASRLPSAGAVLSLSVSVDGSVAAGCLDKKVRVYGVAPDAGRRDWTGFDAPVDAVSYSATGAYLAAVAAASLLVVPRSGPQTRVLPECHLLTSREWFVARSHECITKNASTLRGETSKRDEHLGPNEMSF